MGFTKKLTSAVVAASLVLGMVSTAVAAPSAEEVNTAYNRLSHYNIVQGIVDPATGKPDPALDKPITRAQLLAILVRAWGQEANAKLLSGATTGFADVDGVAGVEWTTGYIFIGNRIAEQNGGQKLGTSATTFNPSGELTAIQTLAFTMKFLGLAVPTGDNWVADTIKAAKSAGLITDADEAKYLADPNAAVNRGAAFSLLDAMFASYNKLPGGKTVYTTYVDNTAPELTVNKPELTTDKAAITVTGSVKGDYAAVYLGSEKITVNADGTFSVEVPLNVGANSITLTAMDMVGNTDTETLSVTRNPGVAAKITASMPAEVVAGQTVDVAIQVTDANGTVLQVAASDLTVTVAGSVGTYADGKFTAAEKVGTGTVTVQYGSLTPATVDVKVVPGPLAQILADNTSVKKGQNIKLTPADKFGNPIASGVTYTWEGDGIAITNGGVVYTAASGKYEVTAKAGDATAKTTIGVYGAATGLKINTPESITANGETLKKITVVAVDEFGNPVGDYDMDVAVEAVGVKFFEDEDGEKPIAETDGKYVLSPDDNGVATAYVAVEPTMAGEEVVFTAVETKTGDVEADENIKGETTVNAVVPVATSLKVTSSASSLRFMAANESSTMPIKVAVVDQEGERIREQYEVTATVTGPATLESDEATYFFDEDGANDATFELNNAEFIGVEGTITVTFNVEGVGSTTASVKHVVAGNPAKLAVTADKDSRAAKATDPFVFTIEVQDRNGVPVALYEDATVLLTLPSDYRSKLWVWDGNADLTADPLTATPLTLNSDKQFELDLPAGSKSVKFKISPKFAIGTDAAAAYTGNITVDAKIKDVADPTGKTFTLTGSKTVSLSAGSVAKAKLERTGIIEAPVSSPKATITAKLVDAFGNAVPKGGVELEVYAVGGGIADNDNEDGSDDNVTINGKKVKADDPLKVKTNDDGKVTLEVVARPYANKNYEIGVRYNPDEDRLDDDYDSKAILAIENAVVASVSVQAMKQVGDNFISTTSVKAGEEYWLVATLKDNYGGYVDETTLGQIEELEALKLVAPADTVTDVLYGDSDDLWDADTVAGKFFTTNTTGGPELKDGQMAIRLVGGKSGLVAVGAKYANLETTISKTANVNVKAGDLVAVVANSGDDIEVTGAGKVQGPFTLALADSFGNTVNLTKNAKITIDSIGYNADTDADENDAYDPAGTKLSFRKSETGVTVDEISTKNSTTFFFVATAKGTYEVKVTALVDTGTKDADGKVIYDPTPGTFYIHVK